MPTASHTITATLEDDAFAARLAAMRDGIDPDIAAQVEQVLPPATETGTYRYFAPLSDAADEYIRWSQNPGERVYTGLQEFDDAMRGLAPKELMLVVGFAHSGKTVFTTQVIANNAHRRIAMFSPDETRVLVLIKLFSMHQEHSAEDVEFALQQGNKQMEDDLRRFASDHFPHLAVFDEVSHLSLFDKALDECEAHWGAPTELVVIDYAQLISAGNGDTSDVPSVINAIKAFGKSRNVPIVLLHQSSRTKGSDGGKVTIDSGGYGGEQQALFLVGVRRKKQQYAALISDLEERIAMSSQQATKDKLNDLLSDAMYEAKRHKDTVTFSLVKNKRPPGRLVDDLDFHLDPNTGKVSEHQKYAHTAGWQQQAVDTGDDDESF